jgi:hypothetical protein
LPALPVKFFLAEILEEHHLAHAKGAVLRGLLGCTDGCSIGILPFLHARRLLRRVLHTDPLLHTGTATEVSWQRQTATGITKGEWLRAAQSWPAESWISDIFSLS